MDQVAHVYNCSLENAMRRRVGDHERANLARMGVKLGFQVFHRYVAALFASDGDDGKARHDGTCWIGAMGRGGDQANPPLAVAIGIMIPADRHQPSKLALRSRIGLQRNAVKPGDPRKPHFQVGNQA